MELTRNQALIKTRDMWDWLANNPGRGKPSYFASHHIKEIPRQQCYLCEFANRSVEYDECYKCPLYGKWVDGDPTSICVNMRSPFNKWLLCAYGDRVNYAKQVADLCRVELKNMILPERNTFRNPTPEQRPTLDTLCLNCGLRYGEHYQYLDRCPESGESYIKEPVNNQSYYCLVEGSPGCQHQHRSLGDAKSEAGRLVRLSNNKGKKVFILKAVEYCICPDNPVEWHKVE